MRFFVRYLCAARQGLGGIVMYSYCGKKQPRFSMIVADLLWLAIIYLCARRKTARQNHACAVRIVAVGCLYGE